MTAYETLQNNVKVISDALDAKRKELSALKNDTVYIEYKTKKAQVDAWTSANPFVINSKGQATNDQTTRRTWISSDGTKWTGSDAQAQYNNASQYIQTQEGKIKSVSDEIIDLEKKLIDANQKVIQYQNESPTYKSEIASASGRKNLIIIGIFLLILTVAGVVIYRNVKKNKAK